MCLTELNLTLFVFSPSFAFVSQVLLAAVTPSDQTAQKQRTQVQKQHGKSKHTERDFKSQIIKTQNNLFAHSPRVLQFNIFSISLLLK